MVGTPTGLSATTHRSGPRFGRRRSRGRTCVGLVGNKSATVAAPDTELLGALRAADEVTALEVTADAAGTARVAGVTEELAVLSGGEGPGVTEAHPRTPSGTDPFFIEYLLLRSDTLG